QLYGNTTSADDTPIPSADEERQTSRRLFGRESSQACDLRDGGIHEGLSRETRMQSVCRAIRIFSVACIRGGDHGHDEFRYGPGRAREIRRGRSCDELPGELRHHAVWDASWPVRLDYEPEPDTMDGGPVISQRVERGGNQSDRYLQAQFRQPRQQFQLRAGGECRALLSQRDGER